MEECPTSSEENSDSEKLCVQKESKPSEDNPEDLRGHDMKNGAQSEYKMDEKTSVPDEKVHFLTCPLCFKTFCRPSNVTRHMKQHHEQINRYSCPKCEKSFAAKCSLEYHVRKHSDETKVKCDKCDEFFPNFKTYAAHRLNHKPLNFEHKCEKCSIIIQGKRNLNRHMQEVHNIETRYDVDHINIPHYQFECEMCSKTYKRKSHLKAHKKVKHDDEGQNEMFPCQNCSKTFNKRSNLKRHIEKCQNID
jgi:KRAB domain-containing zinc finger protein